MVNMSDETRGAHLGIMEVSAMRRRVTSFRQEFKTDLGGLSFTL